MPMMITEAITIDTHVGSLFALIPSGAYELKHYWSQPTFDRGFRAAATPGPQRGSRVGVERSGPVVISKRHATSTYGILLDRVHQAACFIRRAAVVVAVAQRDRGAQLCARRGRFSRLDRELAELEVRAPVDPFAPLGAKRLLQVGVGLSGAAERRACGAALVVPERVLAEHPLARVVRLSREALVEDAQRVCGTAGAQIGRPGLEPHQAIARIPPAQRVERLHRIVVALLA